MTASIFRELGRVEIDDFIPRFKSVSQNPLSYSKHFEIADGLVLNFDATAGAQVGLAAVKPAAGAPHYKISLEEEGAYRWVALEFDLPGDVLADLGMVIPYLEAACPQSTTIFAVLRLKYEDGKSEDNSSVQIELRRMRSIQTFPISLGDTLAAQGKPIKQGKILFFVEARGVDLEIYQFSVVGVVSTSASQAVPSLDALRDAEKCGNKVVRRKSIVAGLGNVWSGSAVAHRSIADGVFVDFETGAGRSIDISAEQTAVRFTLNSLKTAGWRNVEFRFEGVADTGAVCVLIRMVGKSPSPNVKKASLFLREYDANFSWSDTALDHSLAFSDVEEEQQVVVELSPVLSDMRHRHTFGIMVFLPPGLESFEVSEFEVYVYDRRVECRETGSPVGEAEL